MPYDDPDPTDPSILIGVTLPADADATTDMACVFAEEFARMGYDVQRLMRLFQNPFYAGAHAAYRALGDAAVRQIVEECVGVWGSVRFVDQDRDEDETLIQISGISDIT